MLGIVCICQNGKRNVARIKTKKPSFEGFFYNLEGASCYSDTKFPWHYLRRK